MHSMSLFAQIFDIIKPPCEWIVHVVNFDPPAQFHHFTFIHHTI